MQVKNFSSKVLDSSSLKTHRYKRVLVLTLPITGESVFTDFLTE